MTEIAVFTVVVITAMAITLPITAGLIILQIIITRIILAIMFQLIIMATDIVLVTITALAIIMDTDMAFAIIPAPLIPITIMGIIFAGIILSTLAMRADQIIAVSGTMEIDIAEHSIRANQVLFGAHAVTQLNGDIVIT